jgi:UDP:flavonoid glycosyltransferase YjiC (YdhE family)
MRILLTTTRGAGHFGPLTPFADAFQRAGDDILFATVPAGAGIVEAAGYPVAFFDEADDAARQALFGRAAQLSELDSNHLVVGDVFVRLDARAAYPGILRIIDDFRPDLVLHEVGELAAPLAAEKRGVPSARVAITLSGTMEPITGTLLAALDELRAEFGLDADPEGERLGSTPYLTLMPPLLDDGDAPSTLRFREARATPRPLPFRWPNEDLPLVYLTFGSVVPQMSFFPDLYRRAIDGLAALPLRVLVTVGRHADPRELGALPANVHVAPWVPQADVMPHASVMVCHGGSGTMRGGLAAGVPLVILPLFADQAHNARRVAELGAGIALDGGPSAIPWLAESVRQVRADPAYRAAATEIAEDAWSLPPVDAAPRILRDVLTPA